MINVTNLDEVKRIAKILLHFSPIPIENTGLVWHPFLKFDCLIDTENSKTRENQETDDKIIAAANILSVRKEEELKKIYELYSSYIDKVTEYTDFICLINNKQQLPFFFKETKGYVNKRDFSKFLGEMWTLIESPSHAPNVTNKQLVNYFKQADKEYVMNQEELKLYDSLPDEITIYRGVEKNKKNSTKALSWTLNKDKAKWFATRYEDKGIMFTAKIKKEDVLAYFNSRKEEEVVIDYNNLELISTEEVKK